MRRMLLVVCARVWLAQGAGATEPGSYALAIRDDNVVFSQAGGFADLEHDVPISDRTVFRIASLTKQFTAVAVLALVQDGRLSLGDTLAHVLPNCPAVWRAITIEELLSHTSGVTADMLPILARSAVDFTPRALIEPYGRLALEAPPGTRWRYSNVNYWILGLVIEHMAEQPFARFVDARVLRPAGLSQTRYGDTSDIIAHRARGYVRVDGEWKNAPYFSSTIGYAAGGFVSTPADMAHWYAALGQGRIVSPLLIAHAGAVAQAGNKYGLGWYVGEVCGRRVLHHGGSSPGFAAYVYWQPDASAFAGVFANHDDEGEPQAAARGLMERTLGCK